MKGYFQAILCLFLREAEPLTQVCQQALNYLDPSPVKDKGTLKPKALLGPRCLPGVPLLSLPNPDHQPTTLSKMEELEFGVNTTFSFRKVGRSSQRAKQVYIQRVDTERKSVPTKQITFRLMFWFFFSFPDAGQTTL